MYQDRFNPVGLPVNRKTGTRRSRAKKCAAFTEASEPDVKAAGVPGGREIGEAKQHGGQAVARGGVGRRDGAACARGARRGRGARVHPPDAGAGGADQAPGGRRAVLFLGRILDPRPPGRAVRVATSLTRTARSTQATDGVMWRGRQQVALKKQLQLAYAKVSAGRKRMPSRSEGGADESDGCTCGWLVGC